MLQLIPAGLLVIPLSLPSQPPAPTSIGAAPAPESSLRITLIDASLRPSQIDLISLDTTGAVLRRVGGAPLPVSECLAIAPHWWLIPSEQQRGVGGDGTRSATPPSTHLGLPPPRVVRVPTIAIPTAQAKPGGELSEPPAAPQPVIEPGHIDLIDGQRLTGRPAIPTDPNAQQPADGTLAWANSRLGQLSIPLDLVGRVVIRPDFAAPISHNSKHDLVRLSNGDRIGGFVESVGRQVVIAPESADGSKPGTMAIDINQVAAIDFANAPVPARRMPMVWLSDGSVFGASRVSIDAPSGRASLVAAVLPGKPASETETSNLQLGEIAAIVFDHSRLIPLSSLPASAASSGAERRVVPPAQTAAVPGFDVSPLNCDDIVLPGPMTATWELPPEARRIGGWLVLDDSHWAWGDCQVTVSLSAAGSGSAAPVEVLSTRLNALHPAAMLAMDVSPGQRLIVQVLPGENGPVDDHVTLRHVLVLTVPAAN